MNQLNNNNYIEEDEIDLKELFNTILKGKKIIALFTFIAVSLSFIYVLKLPNIYKSEAILIPTESKSGGLGGLGGLAAMAGISVGGGSMTPDVAFNSLLKNYDFMQKFVIENRIVEHYNDIDVDKNYVFALGYRTIYDFFKDDSKEKSYPTDKSADIFNIIKLIQENISISSDKKTALINVSYSDADRSYPPFIIEAFLKDASDYLVTNNLNIINKKLGYFETELRRAESFELRQSISSIISSIIEEKIMTQSKTYYQCDILTAPSESYIKAKTKPKRALILVVSFITSIILSIFFIFFLEFIKKEDSNPQGN